MISITPYHRLIAEQTGPADWFLWNPRSQSLLTMHCQVPRTVEWQLWASFVWRSTEFKRVKLIIYEANNVTTEHNESSVFGWTYCSRKIEIILSAENEVYEQSENSNFGQKYVFTKMQITFFLNIAIFINKNTVSMKWRLPCGPKGNRNKHKVFISRNGKTYMYFHKQKQFHRTY